MGWVAFRDSVLGFFKDMLAYVRRGLEPLAVEIARSGGTLLLETAFEAVQVAEQAGGDGKAKFAAAREHVINRLEREGRAIVENAIQGAIISAVARMKAERA